MLKKIRIALAVAFIIGLTILFLDISGVLHLWFGWIAKIQVIPAILALNIGSLIFLTVLTLLFGRIYCSVICPLGILQDMVSWLAGKRKKNRFRYSKAVSWLRYGFLGLFILALILGISSIVSLLDPYGAYGRIASNLLNPLYRWGNNLLALVAERADSYAFYSVEVWMKSLTTLLVSFGMLVLVAVLAWRRGRTYCNTICPVGTLLGFISRYAFFKPVINTDKCTACNLCARNCKSSCIDIENLQIDYSRCVTCMDCIDKCKQSAISFKASYKINQPETEVIVRDATVATTDHSRRQFISLASILGLSGVLKAQEKIVEGGLAVIEEKKILQRVVPLTPPGSKGFQHINQHCTSCGLCISACPNQVLRPSAQLANFMQPVMSYERGYCRPECTMCSEVCPTSAISQVTTADKSATKIGYAIWIRDNCVVVTDEVDCGKCASVCPTSAIQMVPSEFNNSESKKIPSVDTERCIGCGACENLCPSRPFSAIYVEGIEKHRMV